MILGAFTLETWAFQVALRTLGKVSGGFSEVLVGLRVVLRGFKRLQGAFVMLQRISGNFKKCPTDLRGVSVSFRWLILTAPGNLLKTH